MKSNRSLSLKLLTFLALGSLCQVAHAQTVLPAGLGAMSVSQPSRDTAILSGVLLSNGGENPTVKIRWGDEDRGTAVTPSAAWDNEVTVSPIRQLVHSPPPLPFPIRIRFISFVHLPPMLGEQWLVEVWESWFHPHQ